MSIPEILKNLNYLKKQWLSYAKEWSNKGRPACGSGVPLNTAERLHLSNFNLWNLENEVRQVGNPPTHTANIKRMIDLENARRNRLIEQVDLWVNEELKQNTGEDAAYHTESFGNILDRISVLCLRVKNFEQTLQNDQQNNEIENRLEASKQQLDTIIKASEHLLREIEAGKKQLFVSGFLKDYK